MVPPVPPKLTCRNRKSGENVDSNDIISNELDELVLYLRIFLVTFSLEIPEFKDFRFVLSVLILIE